MIIHNALVDGMMASTSKHDPVPMNEILSARAMVSDGVFTAADALACGYDRQSLSRLVGRGEAVRIGRGSYASRMTYAQASPAQRHRLATRAAVARSDGRLAASHFSALSLLGLPLWRARLGQVQMARLGVGRGRRTSRICIHAGYDPSAYSLVDGIACVSPALAVLGTAMLCGVEAGVVAADAALAANKVSKPELEHWLGRLTRHPGVRAARVAVQLMDRRSESPGESRTRLMLRPFSLGEAIPQVEIRDAQTWLVARVDFLYEAQRTIVEFDGLVKYEGADGRAALVAEKRREDRLRDLGYQVVRVTWAELDRPTLLLQRIQAAFARTRI